MSGSCRPRPLLIQRVCPLITVTILVQCVCLCACVCVCVYACVCVCVSSCEPKEFAVPRCVIVLVSVGITRYSFTCIDDKQMTVYNIFIFLPPTLICLLSNHISINTAVNRSRATGRCFFYPLLLLFFSLRSGHFLIKCPNVSYCVGTIDSTVLILRARPGLWIAKTGFK